MSFDGLHAFDTAIDPCVIAWRGGRLAALRLCVTPRRETGGALPSFVRRAIDDLRRYLDGEEICLSNHPLDFDAAGPFQRQVWRTLQGVARGTTVSYGALARLCGRPEAARAVGGAMSRNPLPLFVPCHRVVPASGGPGAYSAGHGPATKAWLLALEGARPVADDGRIAATVAAPPIPPRTAPAPPGVDLRLMADAPLPGRPS